MCSSDLAWFDGQHRETFWPEVVLTFAVRDPAEHHHVPLLLSPFASSTYRAPSRFHVQHPGNVDE